MFLNENIETTSTV